MLRLQLPLLWFWNSLLNSKEVSSDGGYCVVIFMFFSLLMLRRYSPICVKHLSVRLSRLVSSSIFKGFVLLNIWCSRRLVPILIRKSRLVFGFIFIIRFLHMVFLILFIYIFSFYFVLLRAVFGGYLYNKSNNILLGLGIHVNINFLFRFSGSSL